MDKKLIYILLVLILLAGAIFYFSTRPEKLVSERAAELDIAEVSFGGEIVSVGSGEMVLRTGQVERTAQGNQFVERNKTISFGNKVIFVTGNGSLEIDAENIASYVKVGDKVVVYGPGGGNSLTVDTFFANRIELVSRVSLRSQKSIG